MANVEAGLKFKAKSPNDEWPSPPLDRPSYRGMVANDTSIALGEQDPTDGLPHLASHFDGNDFRSIYDDWATEVSRWIRALMGSKSADSDDVLQEVFVVVHRRLAYFDGRNLAGWLYRITARQVRDFCRRAWFRHILGRSVPVTDSLPGSESTPLVTLEVRERREALNGLLSRLTASLRTTFVLFEIEGYTANEVCEIQGLSINTVRSRLHRARGKLLKILKAMPQGERWKVSSSLPTSDHASFRVVTRLNRRRSAS